MEETRPAFNTIRVRLVKTEPGTLGLVLTERQHIPRVVVTSLTTGSAASRSGLVQTGDTIVRIDGADVTEESVKSVENLLRKIEIGTPSVLLLHGPDAHATYLQTVFSADGTPRTVRVTTPHEEITRRFDFLAPFRKAKIEKSSETLASDAVEPQTGTPLMNGAAVYLKESKETKETKEKDRNTSPAKPSDNIIKYSPNKDEVEKVMSTPETPEFNNYGSKPVDPPRHRHSLSVESPQIVLTKVDKCPEDCTVNEDKDQSKANMILEEKGTREKDSGHVPTRRQSTPADTGHGRVHFPDQVGISASNPPASKRNSLTNEDARDPARWRSSTCDPRGCRRGSRSPSPMARRGSGSPRRYRKLKNLITGSVTSDTLHQTAYQSLKCNNHLCTGSLLETPDNRPTGVPRAKEQLLLHAKDFLDQYYTSIKRFNTAGHQTRWAAVREAIDTKGTYELTTSELTFGAKTAWRNASRCIGRIQWSKLQVFDARHVSTATEMFEAICNHIKYATNKGNIRSALTVFPPRTDGKHDFRVWNSLVIAYAAYQRPDGSIVGDPAQLEFTQICQRMGWQGNGGMFDVLPLVLQANGGDPELFLLPPELVLEVTFKHPKYDWFEGLGLKWYAVPAVSNMMLDCGGLEFTGVPFNGWYMGTEIGARDLCDVRRYNLSPLIATKMGLEMGRSSSLWKDIAILEMNVAVLHSFQTQRVTVTDHHAASESFMKHMENEQRLRGGTPADWVWIVPPISGSACTVFHQEMLKYQLKPSYEYQDDPWKAHVWEKDKNTEKNGEPRRRRGFREIARAVKFSARLMGEALARRFKCTILYGTETGKSETYARRLCEIFKHAFDPKVMSMEDFDIIHLEHEALVLFVTSTFGNGDPPENGEEFAKTLYDMMDPAQSRGSYIRMESLGSPKVRSPSESDSYFDEGMLQHAGPLSNVRFSVFGLGSQAYPKFCAFAKFIDRLMGELGGERIIDMGEGDELCGQEQSFQTWAHGVFKAACETFCVGDDVNMAAVTSSLMTTDTSWAEGCFRLTPVEGAKEKDVCDALSALHHKSVKPCRVIGSENLQALHSERRTVMMTLDTQVYNSELLYNPGDHVGIFPQNRPEIVDAILERLADAPDADALVKLEILREKTTAIGTFKQWNTGDRFPGPITLRTALLQYLDITAPPTPIFLKQLAALATDGTEKQTLNTLANIQRKYEEWKYRTFPTLAEVLAEFPSARPCATFVLSQLPLIQPRFYSISSSPLMYPGEIHVTVAIITYRTQDGKGPVHHGVCSTWLDQLTEGATVPCFVRTATSFHMPQDKREPLILVGPGTGIAPFRSFWQQRRVEMEVDTHADDLRRSWGDMVLYFGCRRQDTDNLYAGETAQAEADHVITKVHTALSRQPGVPKTYVQDLLERDGADIWSIMTEKSCHFYICGDVIMAAQVCETLEKIIARYGKHTLEESRDYVIKLREQSRFHEDIFGTLRMSDVHDAVKLQTSKLPDVSDLALAKRRRSFQTAGVLTGPT